MTHSTFPIKLSKEKLSGRLLQLAALFVILYGIALTLSPSARYHGVTNDFRWLHWSGVLIWCAAYYFAHKYTQRIAENIDPFLLPLSAILTGWGLLSIWRLSSQFGLRQSIWLIIGMALFLLGLNTKNLLNIFRQYKYIWLTIGLSLTALTLFFGTNPIGFGPKLWLGCCGVYLQPSEPLKLLLVIYLSAYLADRQPLSPKLIPLLIPTFIVTGLALALLIIQRDLGTASIFLFAYTGLIYSATNNKKFLFLGASSLTAAGIAGYMLFDVVRIRVDAWINPWSDPSGRSYQIVQSLISIGTGGIFGRGPGLGNPGLVPVALSDFIYSTITEEFGLIGSLGLILALTLFIVRGIQIALNATSRYHRYLATGISIFLAGQSILIIGGTIRMLPLTGVTLPFISYGGSSLVSSFIALLILAHVSLHNTGYQLNLKDPKPLPQISLFIILSFLIAGLVTGWWSVVRGPDLQARTDNARRIIADRFVQRGSIIDRNGNLIHSTTGEVGSFLRNYYFDNGGNVFGYTHSIYGQSGLESALDNYLRGTQNQKPLVVWYNHLLYGQPPAGLNVQLSIDFDLENQTHQRFEELTGTAILLNAQTGQIYVMSSSPGFNPSMLDTEWDKLLEAENAPLLNRATQGLYSAENALTPLLLSYPIEDATAENPNKHAIYEKWFNTPPEFHLPISPAIIPLNQEDVLKLTPLQLALTIASTSNNGTIPAPHLALNVENPAGGWDSIPPLSDPILIGEPNLGSLRQYQVNDKPYWQYTTVLNSSIDQPLTWFTASTFPEETDQQFTVVVLIEDNNPRLAIEIGQWLLEQALNQ